MRGGRGPIALAWAVAALSSCALALADETLPANGPALEKRLKGYDARAVAAARHYFERPSIKTGILAMVDNINKSTLTIVSKQNPSLTPEQLAKIQQIVGEALAERVDLLLQMDMVVALDTFSTDELVALDKFYSSPEGTAILAKMPKMAAQLPAMMRTIMPDYLAEVKAKLKASGAELKL